MGKKSLTKSTTKKKTAAKKKSTKAKTTKSAASKSAASKTGGKKPTHKSLINRKFDAWKPATLYVPKTDAADKTGYTAPPATAAASKKETEKISALLTKTFVLSAPAEKKAPGKKTTPKKEKKTETPKKTQKKAETKKSGAKKSEAKKPETKEPEPKKPAKKALSPAQLLKLSFDSWTPDTLFSPQATGDDSKLFTAPPIVDPEDKATAERFSSLLSRQFDLNAPPEPKPEAEKKPETAAAEEEAAKAEEPAAPKAEEKPAEEPEKPVAAEKSEPVEAAPEQPAEKPVSDTPPPAETKDSEPEKAAEQPPEPQPPEPAKPEAKAEEPVPPKAEEKPVAEPEKPVVAEKPEAVEAAPEKPAEKPAPETPPPAETKALEPEQTVKETSAPKTEPEKPEKAQKQPPKAAKPEPKPAQKAAPPQKPAVEKPAESGGDGLPPLPPIPVKESEPMPRSIKMLIGCVAVVFVMLLAASISNMGNYYLKPVKNGLQIWRGDFSPRGSHLYVSLPGVKAPAKIKDVYNRAEALKPAFDYYMQKADALSEARGLVNFTAVKDYLNKAGAYAPTNQARALVGQRLDRINCMMLLYKADTAAGKKTAEGYNNALKYLRQAAALEVVPAQRALVKKKIAEVAASQKALAATKKKPAAKPAPVVKPKKSTGEKVPASKTIQPKTGAAADTQKAPAKAAPAPEHH